MNKTTLLLCAISFTLIACDSEQPKAPEKSVTEKSVTEKTAEPVKQVVEESAPAATEPAQPQQSTADSVVEPVKAAVEEPVKETAAAEPAKALSGEQVYQKSCTGCHSTGAANAPKLGDAAAWQPRIAKGMDALYASAKNGIPGTAMMAKGTCGACSDDELNAAVDYMVSKAQ